MPSTRGRREALGRRGPRGTPGQGHEGLSGGPLRADRGGRFARVPVVTGSTRDEGRAFTKGSLGWTKQQYVDAMGVQWGADADAVLAHYPWPATADRFTAAYLMGAILTDSGTLAGGGSATAPCGAVRAAHFRWPFPGGRRQSKYSRWKRAGGTPPARGPSAMARPGARGRRGTPTGLGLARSRRKRSAAAANDHETHADARSASGG